MSSLDKIDMHMPLAFYASVNSQLTDPEMVELAKRLRQPRLLNCSVPIPGAAELVISDPAAVTLILDWLKTNQHWRGKIEETLQGLAQDKEGRPLLSAFMPIADLVMLGVDLHASSLQNIKAIFEEWQAMGADEGNFEGYEICSGSLERSV
jgi:hypothetical protein